MAQTKKKTKKKSGTAGKKTTSSGTVKKTTSQAARKSAPEKSGGTRSEVIILAIFAVCVLLFLGDLNLAGSLGKWLSSLQFGLFGTMAYLFPLYLLWISGFTYANGRRYPGNTTLKILVSFLTWVSVCGLLELLGGRSIQEEYTLAQYFTQSAEGLNGGWFGGLFYLKLYPVFGVLGTYVVLIALVIIGLVFTTGHSLIRPLREQGGWIAEKAKASSVKRREEMALKREAEALKREEEAMAREERRQELEKRRTQLKARSLSFGEETKLEGSWEEDAPQTPEESADNKEEKEADRKAKKKITAEDISASSQFTGVIHGADSKKDYLPRREKRTLGELEALDRREYQEEEMSGQEMEEYLERANRRQAEKAAAGEAAAAETQEDEQAPVIHSACEPEDRLDTEGWLTPVEEEADAVQHEVVSFYHSREATEQGEYPLVEEEAGSVHPAAQEFSSEESMAAYDEFSDSPVPADWELNLPGKNAGLRNDVPKAGAKGHGGSSESIWRQGEAKDGNAGVNFTPKAAVKAEAPVIKREYRFPPMTLLKTGPKKAGASNEQLKATAIKLQQTLRNFGVGVTVTDISCGPSVTRYELQPDQGVKVSRIVGLQDDIKLNLAASDIRIEAPIPGKAAVGIEVPNEENQTVYLKELLDSSEFRKFPSKVGFGVGKDIGGKVIVADLARMPHLLIAGATGSGKSVCINTIIMSILYKAHPDEVKLIMIDPKVVELSVYNGIPHLLIPVVTDPKKAAGALNWAVSEMSDRYKRFADQGVRDIKGYNKKVEESGDADLEKMSQIVVIVDELADLMMVAANEVEEAICRLAQLARAAGIHLVLATQRPSVNVITGLIKANVPSRVAFAVSSGVDSRTILDMNGAEKLLGKGDMLFYPSGYPKPVRVQGAFVSDGEVADVVEFLSGQSDGQTVTNKALEQHMEESSKDGGTVGAGERDELFVKAGRFIIEKDRASIGNLQRAFRIGFNRAARIMDQLADYGVVGPDEGTKARQILMNMEQFNEMTSQL